MAAKSEKPKRIYDPEFGIEVANDKSGKKLPRRMAAERAAAWLASHPARQWTEPAPF